MADAIRRCAIDDSWRSLLTPRRRARLKKKVESAKKADTFVDALLYTEFADKKSIAMKLLRLPISKASAKQKLEGIEDLRNSLAHANDYAATRKAAKKLCGIVRDMLSLTKAMRDSVSRAKF